MILPVCDKPYHKIKEICRLGRSLNNCGTIHCAHSLSSLAFNLRINQDDTIYQHGLPNNNNYVNLKSNTYIYFPSKFISDI